MDRAEHIQIWQDWLWGHGLPSFPLFGVLNGQCRCSNGPECRTPGKHPKQGGWRQYDEPQRVGTLDNLGVSTDRLVIVDVDDMSAVPSDLPETFTVSTGKGIHLWYWANPDHPIRNATGWRRKVDIRSVGGLVAAPPSRHVSGAEYSYVGGEIQPVPEIVLATRERYTERERKPQVTAIPTDTVDFIAPTILRLVEEMEGAPEGERNATLFRTACRFFELAEGGWAGQDALWEIVHAAKRAGLSAGEIQQTIDSASRSLTR